MGFLGFGKTEPLTVGGQNIEGNENAKAQTEEAEKKKKVVRIIKKGKSGKPHTIANASIRLKNRADPVTLKNVARYARKKDTVVIETFNYEADDFKKWEFPLNRVVSIFMKFEDK